MRLLRAALRLRAFKNHSDTTAPIPATARGGKKASPASRRSSTAAEVKRDGAAAGIGCAGCACGLRVRAARAECACGMRVRDARAECACGMRVRAAGGAARASGGWGRTGRRSACGLRRRARAVEVRAESRRARDNRPVLTGLGGFT